LIKSYFKVQAIELSHKTCQFGCEPVCPS